MISEKTPFTPADAGYNSERLTVLNDHFQAMFEKKEIQGASYCLARDGKIFASTAVGKFSFRDTDERLLKPDTIHRIYSITKLFCAVAIFQLVEDGEMRLDQPVGDFIEEFKAPPFNKINVAHLLMHTSGLHADWGCFDNKYYKSAWDFIEAANKKKDTNWIAAALSSGVAVEPGVEWRYCSFGYIILGEIITRVSGVFAHDFIMERIVKPCEMWDTSFEPILEKADRCVIRNEHYEKHLASLLKGEKRDRGIWDKIPATWNGLLSTTGDLVKFGNMLVQNGTYNGKRVIGRKAIEKMTTVHTAPNIKDFCWNSGGVYHRCGLGPDMKNNLANLYSLETYYHEGYGSCSLTIDPKERLVAVWFVPFVEDTWLGHGLLNVSAIMWSGLE